MSETKHNPGKKQIALILSALLFSAFFAASCSAVVTTTSAPESTVTATAAAETTVAAPETSESTFTLDSFGPNGGEYRIISPEDAHAWLNSENPPLLLDVRTQDEYDQGHIAKSILIPVSDLKERLDELPQDRDAPLVVYCRSGRRSAEAAAILFSQGYTNIYDLGGIISWPYEIVYP